MDDLSTDSEKFADFKMQLLTLAETLVRKLRKSHPPVSVVGSQFGEDKILASLLTKEQGIYVDVGAGAPVECSNTWQFYQRGWRGLLVEPLPLNWDALLRHRPGDFLCPLAAYSHHCYATLRLCNSLSSLKPEWDIEETGQLVVECASLMEILAPYPHIRKGCTLLSLDVEGAEAEVLGGIDWDYFHPQVLIVEAFKYDSKGGQGTDLSGGWNDILTRYELHYENQLNKIYRRKG